MRILAPRPISVTEGRVADGYQLCARCGAVLVEGEPVVLARRLCSWLIHTHRMGPACPPKAVRGWKAVNAADAMRSQANENVSRNAEPVHLFGLEWPCVCVLDDKHIEAELALVEYQPSDEVVKNSSDLRLLLSRSYFRRTGDGKRTLPQANQDVGLQGKGIGQAVIRNFVEQAVVDAIDANNLSETIKSMEETIWSCRKRTYATFRAAPTVDSIPRAFVNLGAVDEVQVQERRTRLPKVHRDVLARDLKGRPIEFALYSNRKVLEIRGKRKSEFECWALKGEPVDLPYSSSTHPQLFLWAAQSLRQLERVDSSNPYGPVAMLMRESIEELNARRNDAFRCENIQWNESHARADRGRVARLEAVPALAASGNAAS